MSTTVWHIFGTMDIGGAEMRTLALDNAMRERGYRFEYVALSGRRGVLDDEIVAAGGAVHHLPLNVAFPWRFYRELRRNRPQVVDSHVATFSGLLVAIAWAARVPVRIAHFRSDGDGRDPTWRRRLQRAVMIWMIGRFATRIVGVSPGSLTLGYRSDWDVDPRASVVPNGLVRSVPKPRREALLPAGRRSEIIALHVGRPSPEKNRVKLPGIVAAARRRGWQGVLALVGGAGSDSVALDEAVRRHGVEEAVIHLGRRQDVLDLMAGADVVLLPSVREGLPGVVLEALSVGTPVISADLAGSAFIASMVEGVRIVQESDEDWAEALLDVGTTSDSERQRIRSAFEAGPFSLDRAVAAHEGLYR